MKTCLFIIFVRKKEEGMYGVNKNNTPQMFILLQQQQQQWQVRNVGKMAI